MSARFARRAATATVSLSLVATAAAFAPPAQAAPTLKETFEAKGSRAAGWQVGRLIDGHMVNAGFDDWGLTVDTAFALAAAERKRPLLKITRALRQNHMSYISWNGTDVAAGALGKVLLATKVLKRNPRSFGGTNVRAMTLNQLTPASGGFERGRAADTGTRDYSNSIGQAYVVLGLARTGGAPQAAVNYLRKQQCSDGFFREKMTVGKSCDDNRRKPSIDATALAVHALIAAKKHGANVPGQSIRTASRWLDRHQRANGSFGPAAFGPNANSTGLAGSALWITGRHASANKASHWLTRMQLTKALGAKKRDRGAIAYNAKARNAAVKDGITTITGDQFQRATPQAMLSLYRVSLARLTK